MTKRKNPRAVVFPKIRDVGATLDRVDQSKVAEMLGAESLGLDTHGCIGPLSLFQVRAELYRRLSSTGGRPSLTDTSRRSKIPLSNADWETLQSVASAASSPEFSPSAGQVASVILHLALDAFRENRGKVGNEN